MNFYELYLRYLGGKSGKPKPKPKPTFTPPRRTSSPNDPLIGVPPEHLPQPPRRKSAPPRRTSSPNDPLIGVPPTPQPAPRPSTSTYDPRPDSQKPGGKPAKTTIIPLPPPNVDIPLVAYTSGDIHKAREIENRYQDLIQDHLLPDDFDYQEAQAAFERADVQRLSDEQILRIDYLLGTEDDPLTRSMLLAIKHEGIPGHLTFDEYMTRFADWGLVEESDRRAWQVMQSNIKDLTNDNWESARAIDLNSGEEVFLRAGSRHSVLLQDEHKRMLEGRDIALIHNHPNNSPASNADLSAALDLGVLFLVLVTPAGLQYHYRRYGDEMKLVEVIHNPDYVALPSAGEDEESREAYEAQLLAEAGNPAEWVMRQGDQAFRADVVDFARILGIQSDLATLSETELLQEIFKRERLIALGETQASVFGGSKEYITGLKRALYTRETAELIGIDPGILAMVHLWEDKAMHSNPLTSFVEHGTYWWVYNTNILPGRQKSFGIGQVQIPVAIDMLNRYPQWFDDLNLPEKDMKTVSGGYELENEWSNYDVGYQLYTNDAFSLRVAGAYLQHLQYEIQGLLQANGVMVSDENIDQSHVSSQDLLMLAVGAYNQGTSRLHVRFPERYQDGGAAKVIEGVKATVDITYVHNVLSMKDEALEKYGLVYTG